jgi:hypothetical protein
MPDCYRYRSAAADSAVADSDEKSTDEAQRDKLLGKLERATKDISGARAHARRVRLRRPPLRTLLSSRARPPHRRGQGQVLDRREPAGRAALEGRREDQGGPGWCRDAASPVQRGAAAHPGAASCRVLRAAENRQERIADHGTDASQPHRPSRQGRDDFYDREVLLSLRAWRLENGA